MKQISTSLCISLVPDACANPANRRHYDLKPKTELKPPADYGPSLYTDRDAHDDHSSGLEESKRSTAPIQVRSEIKARSTGLCHPRYETLYQDRSVSCNQ